MNIPEMTVGLLFQTFFFFDKGDYSFMDATQNQIPLICYLGKPRVRLLDIYPNRCSKRIDIIIF